MLKKIKYFVVLFLTIQLTGCTFGYFESKNQKVSIIKDPKATILIDQKEPEIKNNKYVLLCDGSAKQITIKREGYKTVNKVCIPRNMSVAAYATIALNAVIGGTQLSAFVANDGSGAPADLFGGLGAVIGGVWGAGLVALSPKMIRFDNTLNLNKDSLVLIPTRNSQMKEIKLNNVGVDIKPEKSETYYTTYDSYLKGKYTKKYQIKDDEAIKIEETNFSDELNSLLRKSGFIDTSRLVLKSSYNQNALLNATIIGDKYIGVLNSGMLSGVVTTSFINRELKIKWDVLDYYKNVVFSDTIDSRSGDFACSTYSTTTIGNTITSSTVGKSTYKEDAIKDAVETSLYTLMAKPKFKAFMKLDKEVKQDTLPPMEIKKATAYASSIEQAVQASVTIKAKSGHGSGFFISEDGYIVTNYHVITDTTKLEVILNDGSKATPKIIRVNKDADLALLKIEEKSIVPFKIPLSDNSTIGKEIYVIGTPSAEDLSQTLSKGIISSIRKQVGASKLIQTDASVSAGDSGGSMIDKEGNLIGIVNSKVVGLGIEGIAFAIPAPEIYKGLSIQIK